jgi:site-specific DNA-methyltransferase (adenine-specific)
MEEIIFEKNKTYLGDCLEIMPQLPDGIFDMILCDLPYGTTSNKWDSVIPFDKLWGEYKRLIKPNGVIALTASQPFSSALLMSNPTMFRHEWIWLKNRGSNFANTIREPFKEHEQVLIFSNGKWTYNKQMQERTGAGLDRVKYDFNHITESENYRKFDRPSDSKGKELRVPSSWQKFNTDTSGLHPTIKPVALFEYLIRTYTNEGELILDNCAGSGTTGEACFNTGRNYIQIEKEQKYFDIILNREKGFKKVVKYPELF